ncbi:SseB family protein [Phaeovulum vinaykumarii]|uniref:SseB protein N-terminal domain-containing protein n=1 Tax=Phaeovulum vinaykumarii TaxID=407234 RepID=A0A1N7JMT2_9RHOB|nr:SseB family protein [Phaeovulum vinaykumarii]SIS50554.1 SseB protein N-terminal domain-containing protein [Phaeovulum vinaykumarii]SOB90316.1 type III secretion system (T3SS) SseB-like protein [Phaeovulum vinaykumarii]
MTDTPDEPEITLDPTPTPFDLAHQAMQDAPDDDAARLAMYDCLIGAELFVLLAAEPEEAEPGSAPVIAPQLIATDEGRFILAFDREDRLAAFTGQAAPYAALPGRVVVDQLAGQGIGLGVNLGIVPQALLLPPEAIDWLAGTLAERPQEDEGWPDHFLPPQLPKSLLDRLTQRLASWAASAGAEGREAWLSGVGWMDGRQGHVLVFQPIPEDEGGSEAEAALAKAVSEALIFAGLEGEEIAVVFLPDDDPARPALAETGWRFALDAEALAAAEAALEAEEAERKGPGMDPDRPPILH